MSIQIIDGFQVNTASPIDNRIVASGSVARNAIPYKYEGLRIFDTSDSIPYVWLNGTWVSENASGVVGSGTTTGYIPKFLGTNIVGNSIIYATGSNIGVNTTSPTAIAGETTVFHVNGGIRSNKFAGDGALISSLSAGNITTGNLSLSRLPTGPTGWVLVGGSPSPTYSSATQLTVGTSSVALLANLATTATTATTATNAVNVGITNNTSNVLNYLPFVSSTGNTNLKINTSGLSYNPSTNITNTNGGDLYISSLSDGYVIRGTKTYAGLGLGNVSINATIATIVVPANATVTVEVTFTGKVLEYDSLFHIAGRNHRSAKFIAAYNTSNTGAITQMGTTVTVLSVTGLGTGATILYAPTIDIATSGQIKFKQTGTGTATSGNFANFYLTADYKVSIS